MKMLLCLLFVQWSSVGLSTCDLMQRKGEAEGARTTPVAESVSSHSDCISMHLFHHMYACLCSVIGGGDGDNLLDIDEFDPPSVANGNMRVLDRYRAWIARNNTLMPSGESIHAFEDRCKREDRVAWPKPQ